MRGSNRRRGLRRRMALSYVAVSMLPFMLVVVVQVFNYGAGGDPGPQQFGRMLDTTAADLARLAARQAEAGELSSSRPFPIGAPWSGSEDVVYRRGQVAIPYVVDDTPPNPVVYAQPLALVADRSGVIVGTSYPAQYSPGHSMTGLVPGLEAELARVVSSGRNDRGSTSSAPWGVVEWAMQPVKGASGVIGVAYVQATPPAPILVPGIWGLVPVEALAGLVLLLPIGVGFGMLTMRGPVGRLQRLVEATKALASADYGRRVAVQGTDELGQLELRFNAMADQLVTAMRAQGELSAANARLAERARLARELHDSISQDLFSVRMTLHGLETSRARDAELVECLSGVRALSTQVIRQMRALLLELRPPPTAQLDLPTGVRELAATYASRVGIDVSASVQAVRVRPDVADALLRIAHEALSNAARHAGASRIEIGVRETAETIELWVADDGCGFAPESVEASRGLGLGLARESAARLGGHLRIDSQPGRGTRVTVSVPAGASCSAS